jgi:hypothetical protein
MAEGKSVPGGGSRPPAGRDATRLESADEIRRALAGQPAPTVMENVAGHGNRTSTRLESAEEIRRALAGQPPPTTEPPADNWRTRIETAEEIRKALAAQERPATLLEKPQAEAKGPADSVRKAAVSPEEAALPPTAVDAVPFRPVRRPPLAVLTICDDGASDGEVVRLRGERTIIGRSDGDVRILHDVMMSTRHAEIVREADHNGWRWLLADLQSTNGTFVRVKRLPFKHGCEFLVGSTLLRFEDAALNLPSAALETAASLPTKTQGWQAFSPTDLKASLVQVQPQGLGKRFFLDAAEQWLGREANQAAIALTGDVQVDARHAKVVRDARGNWSIEDGGSRNGLWMRVARHTIDADCEFQLGEQRFVLRVAG